MTSMSLETIRSTSRRSRIAAGTALAAGAVLVAIVVLWQALQSGGSPDPTAPNSTHLSAVLDIGVLVFREGLECILVLSAITASMVGTCQSYRKPVAAGVAVAFVATLITWRFAIGIVDALSASLPALDIQAATGLLAIVVLVIVMNWFFHKVYWTGWISLHTRRKRTLLNRAAEPRTTRARILWGFALLGFTSLYREGFEVVLFLQSYRMKLGGTRVLQGVLVGLAVTVIVAVLTFVANRRLPYRKMLVATGVMLGVVLLVMVGEQAQEMQLAHWLPTTPIPWLERVIPSWMGLWLAVFPTVQTLAAQLFAALLVLGSYTVVRVQLSRHARLEAGSGAA
jgi:high-affinity iron transporter